jgi:phospholipid/cholesterol/gamma-HCH transport system substrate-binding protein
MKTAIRKHIKDFVAILLLFAVAGVVASVILSNQRLVLPGWVPGLGKDFYEIKAELITAQAVTPGQGQTVNVAGVEVGEISKVELEGGKGIITLRIEPKYDKVYKNATALLRPKTGLKDMVVALDPGSEDAGRLPEGGRIPVSETAPDVNLDEILAQLDSDTRDYLQLLVGGAAEGLEGNGRTLANVFRRFEPLARDTRKVFEGLEDRRDNIKRVIHNLSLVMEELGASDREITRFVSSQNAVFESLASQDAALRATLQELPGALTETNTALVKGERLANELGPTLQALRPGARALGPTLRDVRPFLRETTPIIRDQLRPFSRAALPVVKDLRPAMRNLAAASPDLTSIFEILNYALNELAYNPPGDTEEGYLFWLSWANHIANTIFATQDAHGPLRHGMVLVSCNGVALLDTVAAANPVLGTLVELLRPVRGGPLCPQSSQEPGGGGG